MHVRVARHIRGDVEHLAFRRLELEAVAAAGALRQLGRRAVDACARGLGTGEQRIDCATIRGGEVHAEEPGLGALAQRHRVVFAAIGAQVDGVALGDDGIEPPDAAVKARPTG